jgi:DNA-directed RNA polymerase subunit RPC12/RpoP
MEVRTTSARKKKYLEARTANRCAQCGETIFLPEWSEYLERHRVRHLWECDACGYKFETLVSFREEAEALLVP